MGYRRTRVSSALQRRAIQRSKNKGTHWSCRVSRIKAQGGRMKSAVMQREARSPLCLSAAALWPNMSSSYAAAISALSSDSSLNPPAEPQTSPDPTGRPAAFRPSSKSFHTPPAAHTRSHEPLGCFEEQQENPADYGIGEQRMHENSIMETLRVVEIFTSECCSCFKSTSR